MLQDKVIITSRNDIFLDVMPNWWGNTRDLMSLVKHVEIIGGNWRIWKYLFVTIMGITHIFRQKYYENWWKFWHLLRVAKKIAVHRQSAIKGLNDLNTILKWFADYCGSIFSSSNHNHKSIPEWRQVSPGFPRGKIRRTVAAGQITYLQLFSSLG